MESTSMEKLTDGSKIRGSINATFTLPGADSEPVQGSINGTFKATLSLPRELESCNDSKCGSCSNCTKLAEGLKVQEGFFVAPISLFQGKSAIVKKSLPQNDPPIVDDKSKHCIKFIDERYKLHHSEFGDQRPFFIGLNGIQGAGKTTLVETLAARKETFAFLSVSGKELDYMKNISPQKRQNAMSLPNPCC
jgi:hypothetical protein